MKAILTALLVGGLAVPMIAFEAQAQSSPCYSWSAGSSKRINCLRQEESAARQYARDMNDIADGLRRDHERIGRALGSVSRIPGMPKITQAMPYAWDAPRYAYDGYQAVKRRRGQRD